MKEELQWQRDRDREKQARKDKFVNQYITTFIAAWAAERYHSGLESVSPPVEDAKTLAESAWENVKYDLAH